MIMMLSIPDKVRETLNVTMNSVTHTEECKSLLPSVFISHQDGGPGRRFKTGLPPTTMATKLAGL